MTLARPVPIMVPATPKNEATAAADTAASALAATWTGLSCSRLAGSGVPSVVGVLPVRRVLWVLWVLWGLWVLGRCWVRSVFGRGAVMSSDGSGVARTRQGHGSPRPAAPPDRVCPAR